MIDADAADELVRVTLARARKTQVRTQCCDLRLSLFTLMRDEYMARRETCVVSLQVDQISGIPGKTSRDVDQPGSAELAALTQTMARLSTEEREVLLLVALEELRYDQVAIMLSTPLATVMARLTAARDKLRVLVSDCATPPAVAN
jgi:RNA polymerase sigma-70 factor (ECF subfamily)